MAEEEFTIFANIVPKDLDVFVKKLEEQFGKVELLPKIKPSRELKKPELMDMGKEQVAQQKELTGFMRSQIPFFKQFEGIGKAFGGLGDIFGKAPPVAGAEAGVGVAGAEAGGMAGAMGAIAPPLMAIFALKEIVGTIKDYVMKAVDFIVQSSPVLTEMLDLFKKSIMMIFRPIGDFIGLLMRPFILLFYQLFLIPFYSKIYPKIFAWSDAFDSFVNTYIAPILVELKDVLSPIVKGIFNGFIEFFKEIYNMFGGGFTGLVAVLLVGISLIVGGVIIAILGIPVAITLAMIGLQVALLAGAGIMFSTLIDDIQGWIAGVGKWINDGVKGIIDAFMGLPQQIANAISGAVGAPKGGFLGLGILGSKQGGGFIDKTGLYNLHEGETVVPKGHGVGNVFNVSINVDRVEKEMDWDRVADRLVRIFRDKGVSYGI